MPTTKRVSSTKARAIAEALHIEAASRKQRNTTARITRASTGTGSGAIRFRAARVIDSMRLRTRSRMKSRQRSTR